MSITIHMGYKIKDEKALEKMLEMLKEKWKQNAIKGLAVEFLKKAYEEKEQEKTFEKIYEEMKEKQEKISSSHLRQLDYDYDAELVRTKGTDLCMFFSEDKKQKEVFLELTKDALEYYPYYNNIDNQEGLSDEEWEERGKEWKEAIKEDERVRIVAYKEFPTKKEFLTFIISEEMKEIKKEFVKKHAKEEVLYDVVDKKAKKLFDDKHKNSEIVNLLVETSEEIRDGVYKKEIEEKEKEIKETIKNI